MWTKQLRNLVQARRARRIQSWPTVWHNSPLGVKFLLAVVLQYAILLTTYEVQLAYLSKRFPAVLPQGVLTSGCQQ